MTNRFLFPLLLILFAWVSQPAFAQVNATKFYRLTSTNGLSQNHVKAVVKDHKGFMWFATEDGLNRFDGYKFTVYKNNPSQKGSLSNSLVYDVLEDRSRRLWVATQNGLNLLDREKNTFTHFLKDSGEVFIKCMLEDRKNRLWLGTTKGLVLFTPGGKPKWFTHHDQANSLASNYIYRLAEDNKGRL